MVIGVKNARKFVLVPKMDQNVITCLANVNAAPVIMAITVMNYVPLVPSEAAAQKYAFVELAHMTVTQSMVVASVSLATLDLCVTKVKIFFETIFRNWIFSRMPQWKMGSRLLETLRLSKWWKM